MKALKQLSVYTCIAISLFLLAACQSPATVVTKLYLQDIEVSGPINEPPIHITDSTTSKVTITPCISFGTKNSLEGRIDGHTLVNGDGIFQIDTVYNDNNNTYYFQETPGANKYQFKGNNLNWNIAEINAALDLDFKLSKSFALFLGANYAVVNQEPVWGGLFGFGIMSLGEKSAFRLDAGLTIQEIPYEAYTVVTVTETGPYYTESYVTGYYDVNKTTHFNPFINLVINSANSDWLLNLFLQAGYSTQGLVDFEPEDEVVHDPLFYNRVYITEDQRGELTIGIINLTPGVYFNLGKTGKLILGARMLWISQIEEADNNFFLRPVLQFSFNM